MKTTIIAILLILSSCQKEQCYDFIDRTTITSSNDLTRKYDDKYTKCNLTEREANKRCKTTIKDETGRTGYGGLTTVYIHTEVQTFIVSK
jgi:hypothetical protein